MPTDTYELYGYEIPYRDQLSGAEVERLEEIVDKNARREITRTLAAFQIVQLFCKTRLNKTVSVESLRAKDIDPNLDSYTQELVAPFTELVTERERVATEQYRLTKVRSLELPALEDRVREMEETLEVIREMIAEKKAIAKQDGDDSEAS